MRHSRDGDVIEREHLRAADSALSAVVRILGMPVGTLSAIVLVIVTIFTVWLTHDRAIASQGAKQEQTDTRVEKLEKRDEERLVRDIEVAKALSRIEQKIDSLSGGGR